MKRIFFYLLIATFPLGVLTRLTILPSVNVYLEDGLVLLILLVSWKEIYAYFRKSRNIFIMLFSVFALVGMVGVISHVRGLFEIGSSLAYLARLACYLLLIIPLMSIGKNTLGKMKIEMIAAGFVFVLLGYIQYFYYPTLRNLYYLGWDEHLYRLFSTFLDPNFAGAFIVLIILLYSAFVFHKFKIVYLLGYIFLFPALLLTYSRSSYIMAIFSFILFLILIKQKKLLLILGALIVIGIFLLPKGLGGEGVKLFRTASIFARTVQYENTLKIISKSPIIGVGFNSLRFVSGQYGFISKKDLLVTHAGAGVPNSYLFVMATTGIMGLLLASGFLLLTFREIYRRIKENKSARLASESVAGRGNSIFAVAVFSSLAGVLVGSLFENVLFFSQIMLWLVICCGILFASRTKNH